VDAAAVRAWALLPWDVAWFVWRWGTILVLLWTIHWAYKRRPLTTALIVALLAFPFGANLDTGNINLQLTLMLWVASSPAPPRRTAVGAGDVDEVVPAVFWFILAPRTRLWGLAWLAVSVISAWSRCPRPSTSSGVVRVRGAAGAAGFPRVRLGGRPWLYRRRTRSAGCARRLAARFVDVAAGC
jgi:hypothetical protein